VSPTQPDFHSGTAHRRRVTRCQFACSYPFLLVDRVLEWEYGKYAVGYKCVTVNDNFFPGHFPQRAIMPGA
jgi:3-hydroxymyristoyl/3-hydroxydecanoyl-(acyl carrier protein) dehydratase